MTAPVTMATVRESLRLQAIILEPLAVGGSNFLEWTNEVRTYPSSADLDDDELIRNNKCCY
jgi:hypothetical protein